MEVLGEITSGVAAELNGKYWGCQYEDGYSRTYGFGPIDNAKISVPEFCTKPEAMTYDTDFRRKELAKATLVRISRVAHFNVEEIKDD